MLIPVACANLFHACMASAFSAVQHSTCFKTIQSYSYLIQVARIRRSRVYSTTQTQIQARVITSYVYAVRKCVQHLLCVAIPMDEPAGHPWQRL